MAVKSQGFVKKFTNNSKRPLCTFCGKEGHTVHKCYRKHGYQTGAKNNSKKSSAHCVESLNVEASLSNPQSNRQSVDSGSNDTFRFTKDQYDNLLSMIQGLASQQHHVNAVQTQSGPAFGLSGNILLLDPHISLNVFNNSYNKSHEWVIDTGATDHIACNMHSFIESHVVKDSSLSSSVFDLLHIDIWVGNYTPTYKERSSLLFNHCR